MRKKRTAGNSKVLAFFSDVALGEEHPEPILKREAHLTEEKRL